MKKSNLKGFFAGMITMLLIVSLVGTAGATYEKVSKVLDYRNIKVSLNGETLSLKDAQGNTVEPFIFNGTNYVPARAIAEALGLTVSWDGTTNTIVLKSGSSTESGTLLADQSGIKIYYTGITASSSYMGGYDINLKIVNNSGKDVTIQARDLSVNGVMADSIFSSSVAAGKTGIDSINIYKSSLDEIGITSVSTASFKLVAFENSTYSDIFETDELTVTK